MLKTNPQKVAEWKRRSLARNRLISRSGVRIANASESPNGQARSGKAPQRARFKAGRKTKAWASERARLKKRFAAVEIVTCELRYAGCAIDDYLGFAHAKKRRKLSVDDLSVVILACNFCHNQIEHKAEMEGIVSAIIQSRVRQP